MIQLLVHIPDICLASTSDVEVEMITPEQIRMARAALKWGVRDLGRHAGVSANTVSRFEVGMGTTVATLARIERTLEKEGIIFIPEDEQGGPGVRLRRTKHD